jgi:hypothetical protein
MKERRKRVKRADGSLFRSKSARKRWGTSGRGSGRERETGRDWTVHELWRKARPLTQIQKRLAGQSNRSEGKKP